MKKQMKENNLGSVGNYITDAAILDSREIFCESTRIETSFGHRVKIHINLNERSSLFTSGDWLVKSLGDGGLSFLLSR